MEKLAINGGSPIRTKDLPNYNPMGEEEAKAAYDVVKSGVLSDYLGCWSNNFLGGEQVRKFEKEWAKTFGVKHAITVNSNTSGIFTALGALGVGPNDEVLVSPYSMSISASAPLFYGAVPVFVDIEDDYFCIDPKKIEDKITANTKAIIAVDIFGQTYNYKIINEIAQKYNLKVIEDCAQAPYASIDGKFAGTLGDLGVFSLNYHKHIHTGEGGVIVTNDDDIATRCQLIRNHAEAVVDSMGYKGSPANMVGLNFRMTEVEASIGREQLKKLPKLIHARREIVKKLENSLSGIPFLTMPKTREGSGHSYYVHAMKFDKSKTQGITRENFVAAVNAELLPNGKNNTRNSLISCGYVKPLYRQSLYQLDDKKEYLDKFPFFYINKSENANYKEGICPVVERMFKKEVILSDLIHPNLSEQDIDDIIKSFCKVAENMEQLK